MEPDVEELSQQLLHLHTQHQRLLDLVAEGTKGAKGRGPGGLTQVMTGRRGRHLSLVLSLSYSPLFLPRSACCCR